MKNSLFYTVLVAFKFARLCNNIEFIDEPELKPAEYKRDGFLINNTVRAIGAPLGCGTDFYRFQPCQHIWCQCRRIEPPSQQQQKHTKKRTKVKNEIYLTHCFKLSCTSVYVCVSRIFQCA